MKKQIINERKEFEENRVYLWGLEKANPKLLEEFDHGYKNPKQRERKEKKETKEEEKPKKKAVRRFDIDEHYTVADLPFLRAEYDRVDKELETSMDTDLMDEQEQIAEAISILEDMQELQGGNIEEPKKRRNKKGTEESKEWNKEMLIMKGKGFKKGSPEAIAHAQKMREAREGANRPKQETAKMPSRARVAKGSEEAKEKMRKVVEAKQKKVAERKQKEAEEKEREKQKKNIITESKKRPYYYIGEIPKGYREATEEEAIEHKKISEYGKYQVDYTRYISFEKFKIMITDKITDMELNWKLKGVARMINEAMKDIEIFKNKLENPKYEDKHNTYLIKLDDAETDFKELKKIYIWFYKLFCKRHNKEYKKPIFKLPEPEEIKPSKPYVSPDFTPLPRPKDPRTGKPAPEYNYESETESESEKEEDKNNIFKHDKITFVLGDTEIKLKSKYFDKSQKLTDKYADKLLKKGFILNPKYYSEEFIKDHFYDVSPIQGKGFVDRKPEQQQHSIIQSVVFDREFWTPEKARVWLKKNKYFYDDIDIKPTQYRFRQYNPQDLRDRHYISKKLDNNINLIISVKNEK